MGKKKKKINIESKKNPVMAPKPKKPALKFRINHRVRMAIFILTIIVAPIVIYQDTFHYKLNDCDDNDLIIGKYNFNKELSNIGEAFEDTIFWIYYRPLLICSFIIDANIGGTNPTTYRTTNLVLHILASLMIFFMLLKFAYPPLISFLFSVFVVVHPMLTPAAMWIPGRNDSMITLFILLTFLTFIFYLESPKTLPRIISYIFCLLFFAASLFTKETAVALPLVALCYLYIFQKDKGILTKRNILLGVGWLLIGIIWFCMRYRAIGDFGGTQMSGGTEFVANFFTVPAMVGKIFLPIKMAVLSSYDPITIVSGFIIIIAIIVSIFLLKDLKKNKILFGLLWFVLFLIPTLLIKIGHFKGVMDYAEHRIFLPILGFIILIIEILYSLKVDFKKPLVIIIGVAILLAFSIRSYIYQSKYENRITYWTNAVEQYPEKATAYMVLGRTYFETGSLDTAQYIFERGVEYNPDDDELNANLSSIYLDKGNYAKSMECSRNALKKNPKNGIANFNMGKALYLQNDIQNALPYFQKAARQLSDYLESYLALGIAYNDLGRTEEAIETLRKVIKMDSNYAVPYFFLGDAYAKMDMKPEAERYWLKSISLDSHYYDSYNELIKYYLASNQFEKADNYFQALLKFGVVPDSSLCNQFYAMSRNR